MKLYITASAIVVTVALIGVSSTVHIDAQYPYKGMPRMEELLPAEETAIDPEERELIERVVAAEARGESLEGMMAVAQVISDRAELWGMTPMEVIDSPGQFAKSYQGEISDEVREAVDRVFVQGERVFTEPVTHFSTGSPYWAKTKRLVGVIGCHRFYY